MKRICKICGKEFESVRFMTACSETCRIKRGYILQQEHLQRLNTCVQNYKICPICNSNFVAHGREKYCSKNCSRIALNANRRISNKKSYLLKSAIKKNEVRERKSVFDSGKKGVYWSKNMNKWAACIGCNYRSYHLGFFQDLEDAINARTIADNIPKSEFVDWYYTKHKSKKEGV